MKDHPAKGVRVKLAKSLHPNGERPWPFRLDIKEGHQGSVVHGPFKGSWYLVAFDCDPKEIGQYSRYGSVTLEEIERV
ncbi:MAG: hypothetical protein AB1405_15410 [Bdellovibrionota bacterium]